LELTQPIGRPGDPGEGPHSTKPKRRFQETFSQYASRIWPRVNKIQGPSLLAELEQETCPLRRSEPESHSTNSPQSSNCRIGNTRHRSSSGATNYNWRKEKNGIFFVQCSTGSSGWDGGEPGWGTWGWDQNRTLSPEIARRRLSGDLLFALAVNDGLLLWSFSVWFLASTWSFSLLFVFFSLITTLLFSQKLRWLVKKKRREKQMLRERERARAIDKTLVSSIKDFEFNYNVWNFESV